MASGGGDRYRDLEPSLQLRIRRVCIVSGVWFGLLLAGTFVFLASKPYLDKLREESKKKPGYKPPVTRKIQRPRIEDVSSEDELFW